MFVATAKSGVEILNTLHPPGKSIGSGAPLPVGICESLPSPKEVGKLTLARGDVVGIDGDGEGSNELFDDAVST